jgi:uncharacterized membrane protein YdjX (TVP38/TMEM64 family)
MTDDPSLAPEREGAEPEPAGPWPRRGMVPLVAMLVAGGAILVASATSLDPAVAILHRYTAGGGALAMGGFALASGALVVFCFPGSILMTAAGAAFGVSRGFATAQIGTSLGAALAFLVSRHLARRGVERWVSSRPAFAAVDRAIGSEGWKIVLLTRCCPLFPYVFQNYAYGLTRVSFRHYAIGSFLGLVPTTLVFVYLGSLGASGLAVAAGGTSGLELAVRALGLAATVLVSIVIARASRRALRNAGV